MKNFLLPLILIGSTLAQEAPDHRLKIPADSPLANAVARSLKESGLAKGTTVLIEITPAQQKEPTRTTPDAPPALGGTIAKITYKGRTGAPDSISQTATRSGNQPAIKLVALSPTNDAITILSQPRLWWHQSSDSAGGELEFVLSKVGAGADSIVFRRPIPPMKAGFNVIDLSHKAVNPRSVALEADGRYQWTINLRDGKQVSPAYCQLRFQPDRDIDEALAKGRTSPGGLPDARTIQSLSESGNWHELLDLAATLAARTPEEASFTEARTRLLNQAKLASKITAK